MKPKITTEMLKKEPENLIDLSEMYVLNGSYGPDCVL